MEQRYMYAMFNAEPEKICAAEGVSMDERRWFWLWKEPINGFTYDEATIRRRVEEENERRKKDGRLKTHGRVTYKRQLVTYGDWEDVPC